MTIAFTKMQGLGNDFVVIDAISHPITLDAQLVRAISDRHRGIGCDQVLVVSVATISQADFRYQIFNADGSEAAQCGNGARCVVEFLHQKGLLVHNAVTLQTSERLLTATWLAPDYVNVDMGEPLFTPEAIPFITPAAATTYPVPLKEMAALSMVVLSMGNPHAVIPVADITSIPVKSWGALLQQHATFPQSVNVSFMQVIDKSTLRLRVYERGVGETLACGSGACAGAVAGIVLGLVVSPVTVILPGGELTITWQGLGSSVGMAGAAVKVFTGNY